MSEIEDRALDRLMIRRGDLPMPAVTIEPPSPPSEPPEPAPSFMWERPPGRPAPGVRVRAPLADPNVPAPAPPAPRVAEPPAPIEPLPPPGSAAFPPDAFRPRPLTDEERATMTDEGVVRTPGREALQAIIDLPNTAVRVGANAAIGAGQAVLDTAADVASALSPGGGLAGRPGITDIENAEAIRTDPGVDIVAPYIRRPHLDGAVAQTVADLGTLLILFAGTGGFAGASRLPYRLASGIGADFMNDPGQGGLISVLRAFGIGKEDLEPLDSKAAAASDNRIRARLLSVLDGAAAGAAAEIVIAGIRAIRAAPRAARDIAEGMAAQPGRPQSEMR